MIVPCAKSGQVLTNFGHFQFLKFCNTEICPTLFTGRLLGEMACIFGFNMMRESNPENSSNFGEKFGHLKVKQTIKKMTSLPLFGHIEATLEDSRFEGGNDLQMKKFKMLQKLDRKIFTMSYRGLNLAKGKASKISCEVALRTWAMALHIEPVYLKMQISPSFSTS